MRGFLKTFFIVLAVGALACLIYGFFVEPKGLRVRDVAVKSEHWTGPDLTLAVMTDLHIGGWHVDAARAERLTAKLNALGADIILLPGDFINGHDLRSARSSAFNAEIDAGLTALGGLSAPQGVYASIGNHDRWYGASEVSQRLSAAGINVLENDAAQLAGFCLAGLADVHTASPDPGVFSLCPEGLPLIAMTHSPDALGFIPKSAALVVTGHTHGGQINLPLLGRAVTSTRIGKSHAYGLVYDGKRPTFISAGVGTSILPARFRAPPEIVKITLSAAH